jgi:hypothetical protein
MRCNVVNRQASDPKDDVIGKDAMATEAISGLSLIDATVNMVHLLGREH